MGAFYHEDSPSITEYFSWVNNTNEGSTEKQTLINLAYFSYLQQRFGTRIDIYAWDAGNIDGAAGTYGTMTSDRFRANYPNGFGPIASAAEKIGARLGIWGGADGFGDTPEEEQARYEMIVSLCRDFHMQLFKFDTVCGMLRADKRDVFHRMLTECRQYSPDLVVLNHRNDFGAAQKYVTTFLWESAETYVDVHTYNSIPAPHHRACTLLRGYPEGLKRLCEDHGVCLSSCLDYWQDDFVLHAFGRCLILSPQLYGNPWLLRDDEQANLAYLMNIHRRYRERLVRAIPLPDSYGMYALSRGDESARFVTLRNVTWKEETITVSLKDLGLREGQQYEARIEHPFVESLGLVDFDTPFTVVVPPFRSMLLRVEEAPIPGLAPMGARGRVIPNAKGGVDAIVLYGHSGSAADVTLTGELAKYEGADEHSKALLAQKSVHFAFPGTAFDPPKALGALTACAVPDDAEQLYEATCFAADNNAMEVRSLYRSGETAIPEVSEARRALFEQDTFVYRGVWDRYAFDGRDDTFFSASVQQIDQRIHGGALRLDFAQPADRVEITFILEDPETVEAMTAQAANEDFVFVPATLDSISPFTNRTYNYVPKLVPLMETHHGREVTVSFSFPASRYLRIANAPCRVVHVHAWLGGEELPRDHMRASNLFGLYERFPAEKAFSGTYSLGHPEKGSVLCVGLEGKHGFEGAYAALRIDGKLIGAYDRAVSYKCNQFEHFARPREEGYTYYFPITEEMAGKTAEIVVLRMRGGKDEFVPSAYIVEAETPPHQIRLDFKEV